MQIFYILYNNKKSHQHYLEFRNSLMSKAINIFLLLKLAFKICTGLNRNIIFKLYLEWIFKSNK